MKEIHSAQYLRYLMLVAMGALAGVFVAILVSNLIIGGVLCR